VIRLLQPNGASERLRWTDQHPESSFGLGIVLRGNTGAILTGLEFTYLAKEGARIECGSDLERRRAAGALGLSLLGGTVQTIVLNQREQVEEQAEERGATPLNLWSMGRDFHDAARAVIAAEGMAVLGHAPLPAFFLLGHALELVLKGYLLSRGFTPARLKSEIGHDLQVALKSAETAGIGSLVPIDDTDRGVVAAINPYYRGKDLEYVNSQGLMTIPAIGVIDGVVSKILTPLREPCGRATIAAVKARKVP
jgi:hypothetical protein